MHDTVYDKVVVGGGIAGLASAYEMLDAARVSGQSLKLVVLTERINAPSAAGTHLLLGLDGFELEQTSPHRLEICDLVQKGMNRIGEIVRKHGIECRYDLYYQLIAPDNSQNLAMADFHTSCHQYRAGAFHELDDPTHQVRLAGFDHALESTEIGQINGVEFLLGLVRAVREMGGEIIEDTSYLSHDRNGAKYVIRTTTGDYATSTPPLMAGGPHLMSKMPGLPVPTTKLFTIAAHANLTPEHAKRVCARPAAFFSSTKSYLWGSLDDKNVLTFGHGVSESPDDKPMLENNLRATLRKILPDLCEQYTERLSFSFDAMAWTANQLPIVGRLQDYDVITGNCGRGFAQSFAEARAYADWAVAGIHNDLGLFEDLNPPKN